MNTESQSINKKIIAGIVTFNPEIDRLIDNINVISEQVHVVLIIDNGSDNIKEIINLKDLFYNKLILVCNNQNNGIARALNQIGEYAYVNGYDYFVTLDQDSIMQKDAIGILYQDFQNNSKLAISTPSVKREGIAHFENDDSLVVITSGNLVKTNAWKMVGGFWEYLFIDEVDHEFCYRLRKFGYCINTNHAVNIDHELGKQTEKKVFFHTFHPLNHSAFRRYYIVRNCLIMNYLYPNERYPYPERKKMLLKMTISILCCEKSKIKKMNAVINGYKDATKWIKEHRGVENSINYR